MNKYFSLGLIGFPLDHSISPLLHSAALNAAGLDGTYQLLPVLPLPKGKGEFARIINEMRKGRINGVNVTIPHKTAAIDFVDRLEPISETIGAVNTIYLDDGVLVGTNTDVNGFLKDLERCLQNKKINNQNKIVDNKQHALVLGAGGAAQAVVYGLSKSGWSVTIASRRIEQAYKIAHSHYDVNNTSPIKTILLKPSELAGIKSRITLIVNTTPLGMHPQIDTCPWPEEISLPEDAFIYDLVYNPIETVLIKRARAENICAVTGLGMLIEQAAESFKIWTGFQPPHPLLWEAAENYLEKKNLVEKE